MTGILRQAALASEAGSILIAAKSEVGTDLAGLVSARSQLVQVFQDFPQHRSALINPCIDEQKAKLQAFIDEQPIPGPNFVEAREQVVSNTGGSLNEIDAAVSASLVSLDRQRTTISAVLSRVEASPSDYPAGSAQDAQDTFDECKALVQAFLGTIP